MMLKEEIETLPPPEPPLWEPTVVGLLAPNEKDRTSQALLALQVLSVVSPSAGTAPPVTYRNASNATTSNLQKSLAAGRNGALRPCLPFDPAVKQRTLQRALPPRRART